MIDPDQIHKVVDVSEYVLNGRARLVGHKRWDGEDPDDSSASCNRPYLFVRLIAGDIAQAPGGSVRARHRAG